MEKVRFLTKPLLRDLNSEARRLGWQYNMDPDRVEAVRDCDYLPVLDSIVIKRRRVALVMLNEMGDTGMIEMPRRCFNKLPWRPFSDHTYERGDSKH